MNLETVALSAISTSVPVGGIALPATFADHAGRLWSSWIASTGRTLAVTWSARPESPAHGPCVAVALETAESRDAGFEVDSRICPSSCWRTIVPSGARPRPRQRPGSGSVGDARAVREHELVLVRCRRRIDDPSGDWPPGSAPYRDVTRDRQLSNAPGGSGFWGVVCSMDLWLCCGS